MRKLSLSTQRSERFNWDLWVDWCDSYGLPPIPASPQALERFLSDFPGAPSTVANRIRAIRRHHEAIGADFESPKVSDRPVQHAVHAGEFGYATVEEALANLPRAGYLNGISRSGIGLRGRRDAFLLVLLAVVRLSRREAQQLTEESIIARPLSIAGVLIPRTENAQSCPRCAVTRWLRVLRPAALGQPELLTDLLDLRATLADTHDCEKPIAPSWRQITPLLPAIDKHGWITSSTDAAISLRSITLIGHRLDTRSDPPRGGGDMTPMKASQKMLDNGLLYSKDNKHDVS